MAVTDSWVPPSRDQWEWVVSIFQLFPLFTVVQYVSLINDNLYIMGKTSKDGWFNIPGRIGWITMEVPGTIALLYCMITIPEDGVNSLPLGNKILGSLFAIHYLNRAVIGPILNPSMAPMSPFVWFFALIFQLMNGTSIGGWLAGYGSPAKGLWAGDANLAISERFMAGVLIWALGFAGNIWHDEDLREIRRSAGREQERNAKNDGKANVDKVYRVPVNGLFRWILYPHYVCEWIEWAGFWLAAGSGFIPARNFLLNEISTMAPRAVQGKQWYEQKFGKDKIAGKKALIPGIL
ncbi:3-oxo-5-alpha-steroid 4-dehydrogenase-like protein [Calycina marina]|uniref:3-oxo-5-alpha-steroid 4-dehydrogenase-like protein n=1 Tax=Calycina marina TaxID=1763456 RepID=A0A9P7Z1G7_9HELO|nr:3-oxo-5-alpha-steroid 4-dehydrogenase-like protein [Calycina marina]